MMENPLYLSPETYRNELVFEEVVTSATTCKHCEEPIELGQIRVKFESFSQCHYFHLHCFTPITHVRIRPRDVTSRVKNPEFKTELNSWVEAWNEQFKLDEKAGNSVIQKRVKSETPVQRRVFLESFKYLDAVTLVLVAAQVCKGWYHVTWEDEIWRDLYETAFPSVQTTNTDFKGGYLKAWFSSCLHCKKLLPDPERYMICPVTSRPKCSECYQKKKNRPCHMSWLMSHGITPASLKRFHIPTFMFDNCKCAYFYHILPIIGETRKRRVDTLLKIENKELKELFGTKCIEILRKATVSDFEPGQFAALRLRAAEEDLHFEQYQLFDFIKGKRDMNLKKLIEWLKNINQSSKP